MTRLGLVCAAGLLFYLGMPCGIGMAESANGFASSPQLAQLNTEILRNPQDTALNLRYAALAEQLGKPRLALSAYERVLVYDPQNAEALAGVSRIRKALQPNTTKFVLAVGGIYESNPLYLPSSLTVKGEGQYFGDLGVRDERRLGDYSWRTLANIDGIAHGTDTVLDYAHARAMTGPVLDVLPGLQVSPALGAAGAYWDGHPFYSEAAASATFEAYPSGAYEAVIFRAAYRDYDSFFVPQHDGSYVEAIGKFTIPFAVPDTAFVLSPWVRWSEIKGPIGTIPAFATIEPGDYTDAGARIEGDYSPMDWIVLGANFAASERYYRNEFATGTTIERRDRTLSPGAAIIFPHLADYQTDLRFDFKYISDRSNDPSFSFVDRVVTVTALRRF